MDLQSIIEATSRIGKTVVAEDAVAVDRDACWPERGLRALQSEGLGGLVIPQRQGGLGQGLLGLVRVCETLGQYCPSTSLCLGMHCVGSAVIAAKANGEQLHWLDAICRGRHLTTLALSEPGSGSHFYFPETRLAAANDDHYCVSGVKHFVTNGGHADSYVVSTAADAAPASFSCVVIPHNAPGIEWGPPWCGLGMRGNSSRRLQLHDVVVPRSHLLGQEGDQIWYAFQVVAPYFLIAMAGT